MIKNLQIYTFSRKNHRTGNPLLFVNFAYLNFDDSALLDGFEESKVEDWLDDGVQLLPASAFGRSPESVRRE